MSRRARRRRIEVYWLTAIHSVLIMGLVGSIVLVLGSVARADESTWHLTIESGMGNAHQSFDTSTGTTDLDPLTVFRAATAVGFLYKKHFVTDFEASWAQRGAEFRVRTVFHPEGIGTVTERRTYLDLAIPIAGRVWHGEGFAQAGVGPRLSILLVNHNDGISSDDARTILVGLDPHVRIGYRWVYVTARTLIDLIVPDQQGGVELKDHVYYFGLGAEFAL